MNERKGFNAYIFDEAALVAHGVAEGKIPKEEGRSRFAELKRQARKGSEEALESIWVNMTQGKPAEPEHGDD